MGDASPLGSVRILPSEATHHHKRPYPFTPSQHAELLHPVKSKGQVVLVCNSDWLGSEAYQAYELDAVLHHIAGEQDVYLTMNRFTGRRRITQDILELSALWADIDYYNMPELKGCSPEAVFELAMERLREVRVPYPSLTMCSGQGLYLVWRHTPVGWKAHPSWQNCQRRLYDLLRDLGADSRARDAARVLRLVGTTNSKNGGLAYSIRDADLTGALMSW